MVTVEVSFVELTASSCVKLVKEVLASEQEVCWVAIETERFAVTVNFVEIQARTSCSIPFCYRCVFCREHAGCDRTVTSVSSKFRSTRNRS